MNVVLSASRSLDFYTEIYVKLPKCCQYGFALLFLLAPTWFFLLFVAVCASFCQLLIENVFYFFPVWFVYVCVCGSLCIISLGMLWNSRRKLMRLLFLSLFYFLRIRVGGCIWIAWLDFLFTMRVYGLWMCICNLCPILIFFSCHVLAVSFDGEKF